MSLGAAGVCVADGGTSLPDLGDAFVDAAPRLSVRRLAAFELDASRLAIRGRFTRGKVDAAGVEISVDWTTDRAMAPRRRGTKSAATR